MADTKISALTAGTPALTDTFPLQRGGTANFASSIGAIFGAFGIEASGFLVGDGSDGVVAKTLAETKTLLGVAELLNSGWVLVTDSWAYASASTITVPSGAASIYNVGMSIRWKQGGGYKYGAIKTVADTLLTIIVNTSYTVAEAAITDVAYTTSSVALGLPGRYTFTPSWTNLTVGAGTNVGYLSVVGRQIRLVGKFTFGGSSAVGTDPRIALPVDNVNSTLQFIGDAGYFDSNAALTYYGRMRSDGYFRYATTAATLLGVSATAPMTWATNDELVFDVAYNF